jgi:antitoxin HicB
MRIAYPARITHQDDGKFLVTFPDFEEAVTEGETYEEALFNAEELLTLTLEGRMAEDMLTPVPGGVFHKDDVIVFPSPCVKQGLY